MNISLVMLQNTILDKILPASLIFITGFIIQKFVSNLIELAVKSGLGNQRLNLVDMENRIKTLSTILKNTSGFAIILAATTMSLSKLGINIAPILAGAGVVGLAIGFGAQTFVKDVVTGFFIFSENQFNIGENIQVAGIKGIVKEIKLRTTILVDDSGNSHIIPNSLISTVSKFKKD